jgi:tetratricopeptide (TPR) repeat protein
MIKKIFFFFFLNISVFSQSKHLFKTLEGKIDVICLSENNTLCEIYQLYADKKYDSCYVSIEKALLETRKIEHLDMLYYLQARVSIKKKIYKKGVNSLMSISGDKLYRHSILFYLGSTNIELKNFNKALKYYKEWEEAIAGTTTIKEKQRGYRNLALAYLFLKKYNLAKKIF